jgi:sialate O-acetylesterase
MLFQQNKDAVFAGTASAGAEISAELYNAAGELVASGNSTALADGTFAVSFLAPAGGYEEYKVILKENSSEFAQLENVVFGELWLASGQSNMQYPLAQAKGGADSFKNGEKLSKWIRVLLMPYYCDGIVEKTFADPQVDATDAQWVTGENPQFYNVSAVAYYFAAQMQKDLDMPVGILNASLGGSAIASWLSREAIDGDSNVKNYLVSTEKYIEKSKWEKSEPSIYHDINKHTYSGQYVPNHPRP